MEFRHLKYFLAVADEGSFSHASDQLRISQPSLSRQVQSLERELGHRLFERTARGARLTVAGHALLQHARQLLALESSTRDVLAGGAAVREIVTIGICPGTPGPWLLGLIEHLAEHAPRCAPNLVEANSSEQLRMLREGRLDLCTVHQAPPSDYASWRIREEPFGVAVRPDHPLAGSAVFDLVDLDGLRVLVHSKDQVPTQQDGLMGAAVVANIHPHWQFTQFVEHAAASARATGADAALISRYTATRQLPEWPWSPLRNLGLAMTTWLVRQRTTREVVAATADAAVSFVHSGPDVDHDPERAIH